MVLAGLIVGLGTVAMLGPILDVLGATGETRSLAATFLMISSPSLPLLAAGMGCSGLLRCIGDARRAMNVTLFAAIATAVVDPILIFGLHLGLPGAAISTVLSRLVLATLGWIGAALRHNLVARPSLGAVTGDFAAIFHVAGPALLTNLATPVGAAYVTRSMAVFGPDAVAGQATIDRISPVAFGLIYALSGAVGPILAQNAGAGRLDRVRETLRDSSVLVLATVLLAWAALALAQDLLVRAFVARGVTAELVHLFCSWLAAGYLFTRCALCCQPVAPVLRTATVWACCFSYTSYPIVPVAPVIPVVPEIPVGPVLPIDPAIPVAPVGPVAPVIARCSRWPC